MKVTGPDSGAGAGAADATAGTAPDEVTGAGSAPGVGATDASAGTGRAEGSGRAFADKLAAAAGPPPGATAPEPATQAPTAALARDLEAGRLTPAAAVDQILEQVLAQQVGPDAPAAVREQVRAALKDALENDPLLAEQLRRLGA